MSFYIAATNTISGQTTNMLVQFILRASERGYTECGLPPWTPFPDVASAPSEFSEAHLKIITPVRYPVGMEIPIVAWVVDKDEHPIRVNGVLSSPCHPPIPIRRGVGSGFIPAIAVSGTIDCPIQISGLQIHKTINIETNREWNVVAGMLDGSINWPADSRIHISRDLVIGEKAVLTIGAGTIIKLGPGVSIANYGSIIINGSVDNPVVFTPVARDQPWGGFLMWNGSGSISGTGVLFTGSGASQNWFPVTAPDGSIVDSHRHEQCLFYCHGPAHVELTDSSAMFLAGQLGHAVNGGTFIYNRFLSQHCTTGGEYSGASQLLAFTVNDSAFIECPSDSPVFVDGDNDALYLVHGKHSFTNTLFGWTLDDGIDCGGSGAGELVFDHCWFESIIHEATALSGTGKVIRHYNGVFLNCGQAVEAGYESPTGLVDHCLIVDNLTGIRFGDNYMSSYVGLIIATNSLLLHNYRNVWGMNFEDFTYRYAETIAKGNMLSETDTNQPENSIFNPSEDATLLNAYIPPSHCGASGGRIGAEKLLYYA